MQLRFSEKSRNKMREAMEQGQKAKKGRDRPPREFEGEFEEAMYKMNGKRGIPASCFRNAIIGVCRMVNFKMTLAKLSIFTEADGYDDLDGTPLVEIQGTPERYESVVNPINSGPNIRTRAMWRNWSALVRIRYDADQFNREDVTNLMLRVGMQGGLGEGRPNSKNSAGLGFGLFKIEERRGK